MMNQTSNSIFNPPFYLKSRHLQTILNSVGPRKIRANRIQKKLCSVQLQLHAEHGIKLTAEFDRCGSPDAPLVILLHGWEGSSQSAYMISTTKFLLDKEFDVLRINLRDHGDSHHLNKALFNSTLTAEVSSAIANFLYTTAYRQRFIAGFSLGASFALRIAADDADSLELSAVVAICPPVDPARAMRALMSGWFAYERYFFYRWRASLAHKLRLFPEFNYGNDLRKARTLDDLNDYFIPKFTPYPDVKSYFSGYALTGERLSRLSIPGYLIAADDDPITPPGDLDKINCPTSLQIERQPLGGHCGFINNLSGDSWVEQRLAYLLCQHLK